MQRFRSFSHFLNEASSQDVQTLIQKLRAEADSDKMRIGGTADKVEWAMKYVVLDAFARQLQDDLAKGKTEAPNYPEDLYNSIDGRSTDLKNKAIELMKLNGLSDEAGDQLQVTPVESEEPESAPQGDSTRATVQDTAATVQPAQPPVTEAKDWTLVKIVPGTLQASVKKKKRVTPKSPAERAFRTAFNHSRNEARKVLEPKVEPAVPQQPAPTEQPQQNQQPQTGV